MDGREKSEANWPAQPSSSSTSIEIGPLTFGCLGGEGCVKVESLVAHHLGLERWHNLLFQQLLPVNGGKETMTSQFLEPIRT